MGLSSLLSGHGSDVFEDVSSITEDTRGCDYTQDHTHDHTNVDTTHWQSSDGSSERVDMDEQEAQLADAETDHKSSNKSAVLANYL